MLPSSIFPFKYDDWGIQQRRKGVTEVLRPTYKLDELVGLAIFIYSLTIELLFGISSYCHNALMKLSFPHRYS